MRLDEAKSADPMAVSEESTRSGSREFYETFYGDPLAWTATATGARPSAANIAPEEDSMSAITSMSPTQRLNAYPITGQQTTHDMPKGSQVLGMTRQDGRPAVLVQEDPTQPTTKRTLKSKTAGDSIDGGDRFIGSYRANPADAEAALFAMFDCGEDSDNDPNV